MRGKLLIICVLLCSAIILVGAQDGFAWTNVNQGCLASGCHSATQIHGVAAHGFSVGNCAACHAGAPAAGNVNSSTCAGCHSGGEACPLIETPHGNPSACLACHIECAPVTTTTVPATTTTVPATTTTVPVTTTTTTPAEAEDCDNGEDDDEDGYTDCADSDCEEVEDCEGKVTICHKGHTITINEEALEAHERHGDTIGACDGTDEDDSKGNKKHPLKERIKGKRLFKRF